MKPHRIRQVALLAVAGLILSCSVHSASFDCARAQTKVEKLICADLELSKMDEEMAGTFSIAIKTKNKNKSDLVRQEQKQWLKVRNACPEASCLKIEYSNRISNLVEDAKADLPMGSRMRMTARVLKQPELGLNAGWDFVLHPGAGVEDWLEDGDDPMCQKIKSHMNKVARKWVLDGKALRMNYCTSAVRLAPFFSEPFWVELDPNQHEELIAQLMRFDHNQAEYFKLVPSTPGYDESYFRKKARDFLAAGGRVQHWRTRLVESLYFPADGNDKPAPPGEQDVIQLRYFVDYSVDSRFDKLECKLPNWFGRVFLVNSQLNQPLRYLGSMESLLIYDGDPVLDNSGGYEIAISSPFKSRGLHSCRLTYPNHKPTQGK